MQATGRTQNSNSFIPSDIELREIIIIVIQKHNCFKNKESLKDTNYATYEKKKGHTYCFKIN